MAGTELGKAWVQIVPSADGISGSIQKILAPEADAAGKSSGSRLTGSIKKVIAAAGIGTALKKTIEAGGNLQQSFGGLDTIYGKAAARAKEYAAEAAKAGISQNSFAEQAVSFGASLKQAYAGDTAKAVEAANTAIMDMADNAAKMGTPIQSLQDAYQGFAKQNYTMLDNLKLGYGGTKTEMERLLADAEKLTGQKYDISNLGDVYSAIHAIQGDLKLTGVAADEASTTLTGSMGAMKAAAENLMASLTLGQNVKANMQVLSDSVLSFAGNLIPAVGNVLSGLPTVISTALDTLVPALTEGLRTAADAVKANFPQMLQGALEGLVTFSGNIRARAGELVNAGLELIKNLAQGIINNIPTIIQTVPTIISNFAGIINDNAPKIIQAGLSIIKNLAVGLIKAIPVLIQNLPKILMAIWDVFTAFQWANLGKMAINGIKNGISSVTGSIKTLFKKLVSDAKGTITSGFNSLKGTVSNIWNGIKTAISSPIQSAVGLVKSAVSKIKAALSGKISLPHIKLPHFSVSGKFSLNPPSVPHIGVSWYKKAEDEPYLFKGATLFGAGEHKDEMLYGRESLMNDIREATGDRKNQVINNYFTIYEAEDAKATAREVIRDFRLSMRTS